MILKKKDAIDWLYAIARTDEQIDFLTEGEKRQKEDPEYDLVQDYVMTFKCPPFMRGFVFNDFVFVRDWEIVEYGFYELVREKRNR